jgi:hypothetical protein
MDQNPKRGVITKIFGMILIFLGALDSMLSWRGGFSASDFYSIMIFAGILLFAIGSIRQSGASTDS